MVCEPIICDVAEMRGLVKSEMIGPMNVTDMVFPNEVLRRTVSSLPVVFVD